MNNFLQRTLALMMALLLVFPAFAEETLVSAETETPVIEGAEAPVSEGAEAAMPGDADAVMPEDAAEAEDLGAMDGEIVSECVDQVVAEAEVELGEEACAEEACADEAAATLLTEAESDIALAGADAQDAVAQADAVAEGAVAEGATVTDYAATTSTATGNVTDSSATSTDGTVDAGTTVIPFEKLSFAKKKKMRSVKVLGKLDLGKALRFAPATANATIQWTSSNPAVASVDQAGVVTGVAKGKVTITAEANGIAAKTKVTVKKNNTVVFFGDSITNGGRWKRYYKNRDVYNMGVIGDSLSAMNARVDKVAAKHPGKVFILGGINCLILNMSIEETLKDYEKLLDNVQSQLSGSKIYLLSVLPVRKKLGEKFHCDNDRINELNLGIQKLAAERGYAYIDIHKYYVKNGEMNRKLTWDGLHLKKKAYKYWRKAIARYV